MTSRRIWGSAVAIAALTTAAFGGIYDGYMNHADLTRAIKDIATSSDHAEVEVIGTSVQGRDIHALTLSAADDPSGRPAILIVAGLDGRHMVGSETAVRVARRLVDQHADLLNDYTFYVIARVNPDGAMQNLGRVNAGYVGNLTDVDADRDRALNENGPEDLNGDGVITQMRRANPPLDDRAEYMADPAEPRLLKKPDADKGETAMYSVYIEGVDTDDDGKIAEDGIGYVDLDKNFMHEWPEYDRDSGRYPLSEPEAMALAKFVLAHENIVAAVTYGRHDNLVNKPDSKGRGVSGQEPKVIDAGDASIYEEIGKLYKETTEQKRADQRDTAGSFVAWLYAQRGVPSFASTVWGRPEVKKEEGEADGEGEGREAKKEEPAKPQAAEVGDDPVTGIWRGKANVPDMGEMEITLDLALGNEDAITGSLETMMGSAPVEGKRAGDALSLVADFGPDMALPMEFVIDGDTLSGTITGPEGGVIDASATRISGEDEGGAGEGNGKAADEDAAEWLKYSDAARNGAGFVEWAEYDHPTLGTVEIGGFVPGFRMNPPADELDGLAEKQTEFIAKMTGKLPILRIEGPEVKRLASGLYEIHLAVVNDGYLPTKTAMARKARSIMPTVVRLSVPVDDIVAGDRVDRIWGLDGSGGRSVQNWIVRVGDGEEISVTILNTQFGDRTVTFKAEEN